MRIQWQSILLFSFTVLMVVGCSHDALNPTAPTSINTRVVQETPPSDDTTDSEILTTPYQPYVIAAVGDSITYGEGGSRRLGGYPGILETKMRSMGYPIDTYNEGEPGAGSADIVPYFRSYITGADIVLLMIGSNDILNPNACISSVDCRVADNIRTMLDTAIRMGVKPVLGTVTPKNPLDVYGFLNPRVEFLNSQLFALAASYNIAIADTYNAVLNNGGAGLYYDKHHFTDAGYSVIADEWYRVLVSSVIYTLPGSL